MSQHTSRYHVIGTSYDSATSTLLVRLSSGIYRYDLVPADVAKAFAAALNQDDFFLQQIDERFTTTYIPSSHAGFRTADAALSAKNEPPH